MPKRIKNVYDVKIHQMNYEKVYESVNAVLRFHCVSTSASVRFSAFLTALGDTYSPRWDKTNVYGRMDPIANYAGTGRVLNVGFDIPSYSLDQAKVNLSQVSELITYLYPTMDSTDGIGNINTAPIMRLEFGNLIQDASSNQGLLGFIDGNFTITPDLEVGMFIDPAKQNFYPKNFKLSFSYVVLHTHKLGFKNNPEMPNTFPYNVDNDFYDQKEGFEKYYAEQEKEKQIALLNAAFNQIATGVQYAAKSVKDEKMFKANSSKILK